MQKTIATLLLTCCFIQPAVAQTNNQQTVKWIAAHAIRLKTPEAGHGFEDMKPLKKIIGNARIVSLGEATHGTREFFQLKHRMLEFLASEMGFTIFSIEANMPEAYRLNDYVLNGVGDPAKLLKGMYFWTWDTQEVLEMIRWMREFNKSGKGRVQFTGFDMQTPVVANEIVSDFVARHDDAFKEDLRHASTLTSAVQKNNGPPFGVATATFPIAVAAGKRIRFSGYIKTQNITHDRAGLWSRLLTWWATNRWAQAYVKCSETKWWSSVSLSTRDRFRRLSRAKICMTSLLRQRRITASTRLSGQPEFLCSHSISGRCLSIVRSRRG